MVGSKQDGEATLVAAVKRRRIDPHVRQWAVGDCLRSGEQKSALPAVRSVLGASATTAAYEWRDSELAVMRATGMLDMAGADIVSLTWDGIRIGNPAKEYIVAFTTDLKKNKHQMLPPAVARDIS